MKVLHVIPSFAPAWRYGGPVTVALSLTRELARQGHDVTVMTTNIDGPGVLDVPLERPVPMDGVNVWYFPVQRPRWYCFSRPLGRALGERVREFDIVHIHSIFLWPTTVAAFWCRRRGVPYVVSPHGLLDPVSLTKAYAGWRASISSRFKKWLYLNTIGRLDLGRATEIMLASKVEMESTGGLGLNAPRMALPLGADMPPAGPPQQGKPWRERHPLLEDKRIVLYMSRLDPVKGLETLLAALSDLAAKRDDFALVVAGSGSAEYESSLKALASQLDLGERTLFVGMVRDADKWALLDEADLFILPSYHEAFPNAVVEAMAAGLPVVISEGMDISREVAEAAAGLVTGPDPAEVAGAVDSLLSDEGLRIKTGEAGAEYVREHWTWERTTRDIAGAYESIVRNGRVAPADPVRN